MVAENRLLVAKNRGRGAKWVMVVKRYKLSVIRGVN